MKLLSEFTWGRIYGREKRCKVCRSAQGAARHQEEKESAAWIESMEK